MKKILFILLIIVITKSETRAQDLMSTYNLSKNDLNSLQLYEYYMNNTTIYGIGGVMTILATGLVLTSVNGINKNLFVSVKREGLTMCLAIK